MGVRISKAVWIEVAHRFPGHPVEANRRMHGHSLKVTVVAEREDGKLVCGAVMDFGCFDAMVSAIAGLLDHQDLGEVAGLAHPTLESIAEYLGRRMAATGPLRTVSVKVERPSLEQAAEWTP